MPATEAPTSSHSSEADAELRLGPARHPLESSSPAAQAMGEGKRGPAFDWVEVVQRSKDDRYHEEKIGIPSVL